MKILNLYSCLGGNRLLWENCEVTSIELDPILCDLYKKRFPNDIVICDNAHKYLLHNYQYFDFIWSSPPCPTHSRARFARNKNIKKVYPDLKLYEEILFLKHHCKTLYVIENVIPYYEPLIRGKTIGRHIFWSNFTINNFDHRKSPSLENKNYMKNLCDFHNYDFYQYKGKQSVNKIARNLVDYEIGKNILDIALGIYESKTNQLTLF